MVAPEWLNPGTGCGAIAVAVVGPGQGAGRSATAGFEGLKSPAPDGGLTSRGAAVTDRCRNLQTASHVMLERCDGFFDAVVLAQLDAALAHEFAQKERGRVVAATEAVEQAVREGHTAEVLAHLGQQLRQDPA